MSVEFVIGAFVGLAVIIAALNLESIVNALEGPVNKIAYKIYKYLDGYFNTDNA